MQLDGFIFFILMIAIGYTVTKIKLVGETAADSLSSVLLNVCFPAMVLKNFLNTNTEHLMQSGLASLIVSLICATLPSVIVYFLLRKAEPDRRTLFRYISGIGNTSFVCIPLFSLFLDADQMLIVIVHGAVMDILIWAIHHQLFLGSSAASKKQIMKKMFTSPCLIAVLLGIILCLAEVKLPSFLTYTINTVEAAVSPLALLFIGMLICRYGLLGWIKSKDAIIYSVLRVLVYPCLIFSVLYWILPLQTALILSMLFGSPTPITAVLWCKEYGRSTQLVVNCLIPSTILYFSVMGSALLLLTQFSIL
ncbi:MAG: hypothetical protein E7434_06245 [Ruminococcaceae bacterium]|nr:hypothetical protein [Oscillospiraceae bacterium]